MQGEKLWKQILETDEAGRPVARFTPSNGVSRRSFLAALGYTAAGLTLLSCKVPEQHIVPHLAQPPEQTPGVANWYASTCSGCSAGCGVLVKVRDGRPIKVEGNKEHPVSKGGLCSVAHSIVFGLFDSKRLQKPVAGGKTSDWKAVDAAITEKLTAIKQNGGKVGFLSRTCISPTSKSVIDGFLNGFEDGKHVVYEAVSAHAINAAHLRTHGRAVTPQFHFEKAKVIVSFDADFLGTWISPIQFTRDYSAARDLKTGSKQMSEHIQFESRMSLTGANADLRIKASSAEKTEALVYLLKAFASKEDQSRAANSEPLPIPRFSPQMTKHLEHVVSRLSKHRNESLVISGSNDPEIQLVVNNINHALGNYGHTIDIDVPSMQSQGNDAEFAAFVQEMENGEIAAILIHGANPAYDFGAAGEFEAALKKVPLKISLSPTLDETSSLCDFVCPDHHSLEAWDDAEPVKGTFSFNQPTIAPLFGTRAYQESLLRWNGDQRKFYDVLREKWQEIQFANQTKSNQFNEFWDKVLHDGVFVNDSAGDATSDSFSQDGPAPAPARFNSGKTTGYTLELYQKTSIRDGRFANSPWLQELPDPITKTSWDNYACVSEGTASKLNVKEGQFIAIKKGSIAAELPVMIQPGQSDDCIAVAVGYGRSKAGNAGNGVGANAYPFVEFLNGAFQYQVPNVEVNATAKSAVFAKTQIEASSHGRPLAESITLSQYVSGKHNIKQTEFEKLFDEHDYPDHKWGMVVDLGACTGCNSCVLSCQAENNIPVVGKEEVAKTRDMHWLRIDRYYEETKEGLDVNFQPLPCMQCENASCEMVCPVLATVHSSEGLNMQVYNRCVGTRYCANNCAYKVRHFNWFEYPHDDPIANLALNPDVTVRSRGVMEKCTFCVQRIEEKKILARNEGRPIKDGEIQTACQQSCPANAIIFGDQKELKSMVNENKKNGRNYILLEDLNTKPAVSYLAKVNNREDGGEEHS